MSNRYYIAFGLIIDSEIPLDLLESPKADSHEGVIFVKRARLIPPGPLLCTVGQVKKVFYGIYNNDVFINVPDVAIFRVTKECNIEFFPIGEVPAQKIGNYITGVMLLFVLKKKDYLLLHGSAVCGIDAGIIFMGDRGSGKSTTAASLCSSGYKMLCDDVVPISKGGIVRPGIPRPKLLYDAVENVLSDFSGVALKFDGYDKYHADLPFCEISKKIKLIIQLQTKKLRTIEIEKLLGIDRLMATLRNAIFLEGLETPEEHFLKASEFLSFVPVFTISRPDESYSLEAVVDAVQRLYNSPLD